VCLGQERTSAYIKSVPHMYVVSIMRLCVGTTVQADKTKIYTTARTVQKYVDTRRIGCLSK
jgi:hypothetical protein